MLPSSEVPLMRGSISVSGVQKTIPSPIWDRSVEKLGALKARVPRARELMGHVRWASVVNRHRSYIHATPPPLLASRAYHKLREILFSCAIPAPHRSAHLCEAPGGFVQATAEAVRENGAGPSDWSWVAVSLPESSTAPSMATALLPMGSGTCIKADMLADGLPETLDASFDLVTADGAGPMDHDDLEREHLPLLRSQTKNALRLLMPGGTLVIKFFEGSLPETRVWMAGVTLHFRRVSEMKPTRSRPTNSERYLVASSFQPPKEEAPPLEVCRTSAEWDLHARLQLVEFHEAQIKALTAAVGQVPQSP